MEILKPYKITKESSDGTFLVGDIIWQSENGDINSMQGKGWITPSEVEQDTLDFEYEDADNYEVISTGRSEICRQLKR